MEYIVVAKFCAYILNSIGACQSTLSFFLDMELLLLSLFTEIPQWLKEYVEAPLDSDVDREIQVGFTGRPGGFFYYIYYIIGGHGDGNQCKVVICSMDIQAVLALMSR